MSTISEKQLRARIQQAQAENQNAAQNEHDKRMFVERDNGIDFWRETAMSWHSKAKRLADQLQIAQHDVRGLGNEVKLTSIERDHWRAEYDQNYQDVLRAEARCDAFSDIMDALGRGYRMEPFDGCAKWWRHDTDTLQAIAKAAREWEAEQDSKPVYMGKGEGEPFTMGTQQFLPECAPQPDQALSRDDMIAFIEAAYSQGMSMQIAGVHTLADAALQNEFELAHRFVTTTNERREREAQQQAERTATDLKAWTRWEWEYKPNSLDDYDTVEIVTHDGKSNNLEAGVVDWAQVKSYRVIESAPVDQASPIDDGEQAQQADGFNGHMIGTDGDRVGFLYHAAKYGFKSDYNPENATSAQIEDDYSRAFAYMVNHSYPLKPQ